jgi:membrane protease YdiL (CAAX protease family)
MVVTVVLSIALVAWSLVANLIVGDQFYVVRNLLLVALLLIVARQLSFSWGELGLDLTDIDAGLAWSRLAVVTVALVMATSVGLAEVIRPVGLFLGDRRADVGGGQLLSMLLFRIPIGTAVFEEIAFRGLLLAMLLQVTSPTWAIAWSSIVFGLWHIAPTMAVLRTNGMEPMSLPGLRAVVGAVLVTTVAGVLLAWLRLASGSLLAPILAHWAANGFGLLAAAVTEDPTAAIDDPTALHGGTAALTLSPSDPAGAP